MTITIPDVQAKPFLLEPTLLAYQGQRSAVVVDKAQTAFHLVNDMAARAVVSPTDPGIIFDPSRLLITSRKGGKGFVMFIASGNPVRWRGLELDDIYWFKTPLDMKYWDAKDLESRIR